MLIQIWNSIASNTWTIAIATFAFFALKGLLWIAIPYLAIRWRGAILGSEHRE